ncbi:DNA (cytosine-5-)-methyltransferase [Candidatus Nitrosopumilus sediminis]|uniref:DNA (cytosine-5-)-methyltransferase n=1 Tax=Candidatus Nitrosopumilus sediminis TaxID=1229909 RepID=K0BEC6_9ARCH|nr:DNA (cytosine-5-)-methyltransferase [Candidatus Nitrosopumilus sediminis]AFS83380.1 modification methylase [Candidatus Nitrosopumilus sediminis]
MEKNTNFKFIDLFAGIGGMRIAFEGAGGKCVFSSEWNKYAQETYEKNFGEVPFGDITKIDENDIPDHDVLVAGFPCQPFSLAGIPVKKFHGHPVGFKDLTQGTLFFDIARILKAKKPSAFLLENVKNLKSHDKGNTLKTILRVLEDELGYDVHYEVLDAVNVVPQHRERLFIAGFITPRNFKFPKIPNKNIKLSDILEKKVDKKYVLTDGTWNALKRHLERHRKKGNGFGYTIADKKKVANTLSARYYKDGAQILISRGQTRNPRRLTPNECAKLMGFPKNFQKHESDNHAYRQFGNSVVVPVVKVIAKEIIRNLPVQKKLLTPMICRK